MTLQAPVTEAPLVNGRLSLLVVLLLSLGGAVPGSRAADNPLQLFRQLSLPGGIASAATCINFAAPDDGGPTGGRLELDGLPPGAAVQEAFLYWTVLAYSTPVPSGTPALDGTPLVPVPLGELPETPCYGPMDDPYPFSGAFRADVTGLVPANGSYSLTGLLGDGTPNPPELTEGASLWVIYCAPGEPERAVVIFEGYDVVNQRDDPLRQDLSGFVAASVEPVSATLFAAAGNGQARSLPEDPGLDPFVFNGVDLDLVQSDILSGSACWSPDTGLYDRHEIDVTGLVGADDTTASLEIATIGDCYTIAAVALVVDTVPGLGLPEPSALDLDPLATPLTLRRSPSGLELRWEDLGAGAIYHAYRGSIGAWYDHGSLGACDLVTPQATLTDEPGNHYFLAVTEGCGGAESTTGRDSFGAGRPGAGGTACP